MQLRTLSFALAAASAVAPRAGHAGPTSHPPRVHRITASDAGLGVNGYLVEGEHGLVAIDSALTVSDGKALRRRADALGKPLLAILITHGHPDHYNGAAALVEGRGVPIYATAAVTKVIKRDDAAKTAQWQPVFKTEWPTRRVFPDHVASDGAKLVLDGMTFVVHDLGPAESHADSYWELLGAERTVFIGDQVLAGSHAYTNDGHTALWLADLDRLSRDLEGVARIYPGHGEPGDTKLLAWEKGYLEAYRAEVDKLRAGRAKLTDAEKQALVTHMTAAYPGAKLEFMIALGADTTAAELAGARKP
jgi:glyoxylase-like metal-dependent hydrolase (beta-lactamase superfamily II)